MLKNKTLTLPTRKARVGGLQVSLIGLGCMGMSEFYGESKDDNSKDLLFYAIEQGVRFFDTADVYGYGHNEKLLGACLRDHPLRNEIVLATKGGIVRDDTDTTRRGINNSPEYLRTAVERSLERLQTPIDLYYIHRIEDHGAKIEESMHALAELVKEGKIGAIGLSEASADIIRRADAAVRNCLDNSEGLAAVQTEYSLMTRNVEIDGVDDACRDLGILLIAYSPVCRGLLTTSQFDVASLSENDFRKSLPRFTGANLARNRELVAELEEVAHMEGVTPAQVALAWVLTRGTHIVPIPGTRSRERFAENLKACQIELSSEAGQKLEAAFAPNSASGLRYTEAAMRAYNFEI